VKDNSTDVEQERRYYRLVISLDPPWRPAFSLRRGVLRFSGKARRALALATEEAAKLRHNYIGTEHLLLGVIREGENSGSAVLESLGINLGAVREQVEEIIGDGRHKPSGAIPYTPRAKKVLELSQREALRLGDRHAGGEHLLLGLIREGEGVAAQVLVRLGADLERVRQQLAHLGHRAQDEGDDGPVGPVPEPDDADLHSVRYQLRPPSQAASTFSPAPVTSAEDPVLPTILTRLDSIDSRLSAIEKHLGEPGG
jgi:ATP-dependent Clp protease ATP-binding subunit ClpA